jgi:hypothetical protein
VWSVPKTLTDSQSYPGQQVVKLKLTGVPNLVSTTVTTGVIAATYQVQAADITNFATRFGNAFDEYRILGCDINVRPVNSASGVSAMFFDEKSQAAPTLADASERTLSLHTNSNASSQSVIVHRWRARDLLDLEYTAISTTTVIPVTFKIYTDTANYAAPIVVTAVWLVEPSLYIEFRGIKSL